MTKAKPKAKPRPAKAAPVVVETPQPVQSRRWADSVAAVSSLASVALLAFMLWGNQGDKPTPPKGEFATFEQRIRTEVWGEGARKAKHGEFKDARDALKWMQDRWPAVEGEVFAPNDKEEAIAGQDLDALAALWERWSQ
jgi:hypothetical protein